MIARHENWSVRALSVVLVALCAMALASTSASAEIVHKYEGSFNGADAPGVPAPGGPFAYVLSDAADDSGGPSSGDVYVGVLNESFEGLIDKFNSKGEYAGVQITGAETPQGSLELASLSTYASGTLAVDDSPGPNKGDLYVPDTGHGVVDKFNEEGEYLCQITGSATLSPSECAKPPDSSETPAGSMEPTGVAVDADGTVYVADSAHRVIDKFNSTGEYAGQFADARIKNPGAIALDGNHLYIDNGLPITGGEEGISAFSSGEFAGVLDGNGKNPLTVTFDAIDGHVYTGGQPEAPGIREYDPSQPVSQALLDTFGVGEVGRVAGLSAGPSGTLYAADFENKAVEIFGPDMILPDVSVGASEDRKTTATLTGRVDPAGGGEVTGCRFEYGISTSYGQSVPCSPEPSYQAATNVDANVTGLSEGATYHFRLVAANANGADEGKDHVFGPPAIDSESATALTTSASARAKIDPSGVTTACEVQYVDEEEFQSAGYGAAASAPCTEQVGWEAGERSAAATLTGLQLDTTYHYRFIATSGAGVATGADHTFATFGITAFSFEPVDQEGYAYTYTQAGGHPNALRDSFALNTSPTSEFNEADANVKDIRTELPPGLIGNPNAVPKCAPYNVTHVDCPGASQVGVLTIYTARTPTGNSSPLYNLIPPKGLAAQFGARFSNFVTVHIDAHVRTGSDYGVTAEVLNGVAAESVTGASVTLWGVPADASHDGERDCPTPNSGREETHCASDVPQLPFLTDPTSCSGPQTTTMSADSWQSIGSVVQASSVIPGFTGCEKLGFTPQITVQLESAVAASPTGLHVDLHVPQNEDPTGLAEADLKDAVVTLPQGVTVNPSSANGLKACSPAQIELHGSEPAQCPDASKIGSVEVDTPLIDHPLDGAVYVAQQGNAGPAQGANPFGSLLALYIAVDDPQTGVVVKLAGEVTADPLTGQLTTSFLNNPQLPFEDLKLDIFGGPRAPLGTPPACGGYTTTTSLTPWSAPESGPPATPSSSFAITSDPGGSPCPDALPFAPTFTAGTTNIQAGAFSPFTATMAREDGNQTLRAVALQMPPGLSGVLSGVELCGEAQADAGTCSPNSLIGEATAQIGLGADPYTVTGKVYLTGPYGGAPFGLSVVTPAVAGPFNLGTVVVRAKIGVDPHTAQITVSSDESGLYAIPKMLDGIPLQLKRVKVTVDRSGFTFNPTNCKPMAITSTISSSEGATAGVSAPFQVTNCATLAFKPKLAASTSPKSSKADGASLTVKLTYPNTPQGTEANIAKVKVDLPKQLPSRLTTLQKACVAKVFEANPAGCPAASIVGHAKAITPILPVPLEGPAYFVSHGGEAFPSLIFVLQGYGVTEDLVGTTFISKAGITSSTFKAVPDVPVGTFELTLPQEPYSALAANLPANDKGSFCGQKLTMPTAFVGQNGAEIHTSTPISVTGCKPAITVVRHSVKGTKATIVVSVPAAGRLLAAGRGVSTGRGKAGKAGNVHVKVTLTKAEQAFLRKHPSRKLRAKIDLRFIPRKGAEMTTSVTVLIA